MVSLFFHRVEFVNIGHLFFFVLDKKLKNLKLNAGTASIVHASRAEIRRSRSYASDFAYVSHIF